MSPQKMFRETTQACLIFLSPFSPTLSIFVLYLALFDILQNNVGYECKDFGVFFTKNDLKNLSKKANSKELTFGKILCSEGFVKHIILSIVFSFCFWIPGVLFSLVLWLCFYNIIFGCQRGYLSGCWDIFCFGGCCERCLINFFCCCIVGLAAE
jgi:hypothetical protein